MKSLITAILMTVSLSAHGELVKPKTYSDFEKVTVKITDKTMSSGGTGWILKSTPLKSYIVTNGHVCNLQKRSGSLLVTGVKGVFQVERVKYSKLHDLCLMEVYSDLEVDTRLADRAPEKGEKITISGHPRLFPLMLTEGTMTGNMQITVVVDVRPCNPENEGDVGNVYCQVFGIVPVFKNYESRLSSAFIAGGNSGSGVFNSSGEVVGVAFAGVGEGYSQSILVPFEFLNNFVKNEAKTLEWVHISAPKELVLKNDKPDSPESKKIKKTIVESNLKNLVYTAIEDEITKMLTTKIIQGTK